MNQNDYRRKIYNCESAIDSCRRDIRKYEEYKDQLNILKKKLRQLLKNIERSKSKGQKDIQKLKTALSTGRRLFKGQFFRNVKNVFGDTKYTKARNEIESNISSVEKKIKYYDKEISKKRAEISQLSATISNYRIEIRALDTQERNQ